MVLRLGKINVVPLAEKQQPAAASG